jgi:hypothetical protein
MGYNHTTCPITLSCILLFSLFEDFAMRCISLRALVPCRRSHRLRIGNMCYLLVFLLATLTSSIDVQADNLVNNPSFEVMINCPVGISDLGDQLGPNCANWFSANAATPDYFHNCTQATICIGSTYNRMIGVPQNTFGYQAAFNDPSDPDDTQNAYAGIIYAPSSTNSVTNNRREYIEVSFSSPLEKDQLYEVSFYVSLADGSSYALTDLGAYITTGTITSGAITALGVQPQIHDNTQFFTNKVNWVQIKGTYKAIGGEDHLVIGYFRTTLQANTDYTTVPIAASDTSCYATHLAAYDKFAYYYIDNVSVKLSCRCGEGGYTVTLTSDNQRPVADNDCCYWVNLQKEAGACTIRNVRLHVLPGAGNIPNPFSQVYNKALGNWQLNTSASSTSATVWTRTSKTPFNTGDIDVVGGFCIPAALVSRRLVIEYLDNALNYMCADTVDVPECLPDCCETLVPVLYPFADNTSGTCCYSIVTPLSASCDDIASVRISSRNGAQIFLHSDPSRTLVSSLTFNRYTISPFDYVGGDLCLYAGSGSYPIRLEYCNAEGDVLCTKDTVLDCNCHCGIEFYESEILPVHDTEENQCCWTLSVNAKYGSCPLGKIKAEIINTSGSISVLNVSNLSGGLLIPGSAWNSQKFCLSDGALTGNDSLRICYFDNNEVLLCCVTQPIWCMDCCEKLHVFSGPTCTPASPIDPEVCCRGIYITSDSGFSCDIYEVRVVNAGGGIPHQSTPIVFPSDALPVSALPCIGNYCLEPGETRVITVEFLDNLGEIRCSKSFVDSCHQKQCCDSIFLGFEYPVSLPGNPPDQCCASIYAIQSTTSDCKVYGVNVINAQGGISYDPNRIITFPGCGTCIRRTVGGYCLQPGETRTITIEFLKQDGAILCTKTLTVSCPAVDSCCDKLKIETEPDFNPDGSCCHHIALSKLPGLSCAIYGVSITGPGAQGGILPQSTPINLPAYNPWVVSSLIAGSVCAPANQSRTVTVRFLGINGNVLCTKTVTVTCSPDDMPKQGEAGKDNTTKILDSGLRAVPNPASGSTAIYYHLASHGVVSVELYNSLGQLITLLEKGVRETGEHAVNHSTRRRKINDHGGEMWSHFFHRKWLHCFIVFSYRIENPSAGQFVW